MIFSSINIYIKEKLKSVAVLKCLGASRKQTFKFFLLQIIAIGAIGGIIGAGIGTGLRVCISICSPDFLALTKLLEDII